MARVQLHPGSGRLTVNGRSVESYFPRHSHQQMVMQPFEATEGVGRFDVAASICGGGPSGQAGALRHGIARALEKFDANLRTTLKRAGYLTRDARKKERKKYGQRGARARYQFSKR